MRAFVILNTKKRKRFEDVLYIFIFCPGPIHVIYSEQYFCPTLGGYFPRKQERPYISDMQVATRRGGEPGFMKVLSHRQSPNFSNFIETMEAKKHIFMFAIMPPAGLAKQIDGERLYFAEKYNSRAALKPPVHITIYPPFTDTEDLPERAKGLHQWASTRESLNIDLRNFDWFDNRRSPVLYIHVERSRELTDLRAAFMIRLKEHLPEVELMGEYKPHITIGYRDIPEELLPQIREEYATRAFEGTFEAFSILLWEHNGQRWNVVDEYCFNRE